MINEFVTHCWMRFNMTYTIYKTYFDSWSIGSRL